MLNRTGTCPTERLYRDHQSWLQDWFRLRLGCSTQAADLAQDTFLRVLARREQTRQDPLRQPRAFLRVIAKGLLVDHYRRRSLEQSHLEALANLPDPTEISPEEREILLETLHSLDATLDRLSALARKAFLLSQMDGLTYGQIAEEFGVSERTIKRYMQQGFKQCIATMV